MSRYLLAHRCHVPTAKLMDAAVRVKCLGGRELRGILKGFDDLVNIVLDDCEEFLRGTYGSGIVGRVRWILDQNKLIFATTLDPDDLQVITENKRMLGRVVIRGPQVSLISPEDGMEEIANPFLAAEDEEDDGEE